jgi:hypothetical protein
MSPQATLIRLGVTHHTLWRWAGGLQGEAEPIRIQRYYPELSRNPMYWRADVEKLHDALQVIAGRK